MRMRGPWYATKRLFASFATGLFFEKFAGSPMTKSMNMVWGPHIARVKTKNLLNFSIGLFKGPFSNVE